MLAWILCLISRLLAKTWQVSFPSLYYLIYHFNDVIPFE